MLEYFNNVLQILFPFQFDGYWLLFIIGFTLIGLSRINIIRKPFLLLHYKLFGYGKCIECEKKRESFWLLTCNKCYLKKFPDKAPQFDRSVKQ